MINDPIIEEIHKYRNDHALEFDYDIKKIVEHYQKRQKQHKGRIVNLRKKVDNKHTGS